MHFTLVNPFLSALEPERVAETAAAPSLTDPSDAAAENFDDDSLLLFLTHPAKAMERELAAFVRISFGLGEALPAFLSRPRPEYLAAVRR